MNLDAAALLEQAGRCAHLLERESDGDRFDGVGSDAAIRIASDQELLRALAEATRLARLVEAERIKLAGEIARRSGTDDETSLAKKSGTTGPVDLIAQVTGTRRQESGVLVTLGRAVRRNETFAGDVLPPRPTARRRRARCRTA